MMHDQDLPTSLWAEATRTAVYIKNRSPHSVLGEKTPEEVFSEEKPDVGHLRIFECPVFIHVPKEKITKMEPSGKKGIFVGYCYHTICTCPKPKASECKIDVTGGDLSLSP